jgi:hypothetical protein
VRLWTLWRVCLLPLYISSVKVSFVPRSQGLIPESSHALAHLQDFPLPYRPDSDFLWSPIMFLD